MNRFTKIFIVSVVWTVGFASLAGYASGKAMQNDPELMAKIQEKYNLTLNLGGIVNDGPLVTEITKDSWNVAVPTKKIVLKSVSADFTIEKTTESEIKIAAEGTLDKNKALRLLEVTSGNEELLIAEPKGNATKNVKVTIEIPTTFRNHLEIVTASGEVFVQNSAIQEIEVKTVSGDILFYNSVSLKVIVESVSGEITADACSFAKIEGGSVSGDIEISNRIPLNTEFTTVSGDIKMHLPKTDDTQFALKTVSGDVKNRHSTSKAAKFIVNVSTTSGDIDIK